MFTVKIITRQESPSIQKDAMSYLYSTKVIEAVEVDIQELKQKELIGVSGFKKNGECFMYYVADLDIPRSVDFAGGAELACAIYIENSTGATTEVVKV